MLKFEKKIRRQKVNYIQVYDMCYTDHEYTLKFCNKFRFKFVIKIFRRHENFRYSMSDKFNTDNINADTKLKISLKL